MTYVKESYKIRFLNIKMVHSEYEHAVLCSVLLNGVPRYESAGGRADAELCRS